MKIDENKWARFADDYNTQEQDSDSRQNEAEQAKPTPVPPFEHMLAMSGFDDELSILD